MSKELSLNTKTLLAYFELSGKAGVKELSLTLCTDYNTGYSTFNYCSLLQFGFQKISFSQ